MALVILIYNPVIIISITGCSDDNNGSDDNNNEIMITVMANIKSQYHRMLVIFS